MEQTLAGEVRRAKLDVLNTTGVLAESQSAGRAAAVAFLPGLLTDEQWRLIEPVLVSGHRGVGVVPSDERRHFDAVVWLWRTGEQARRLPDAFPPFQVVWRSLKRWRKRGLFETCLVVLRAQSEIEELRLLAGA